MTLRFLKAVWEAIYLACSNTEKNPDTDRAFESLSDLLRGYSNQDFVLFIEGHVIILHPIRDSLFCADLNRPNEEMRIPRAFSIISPLSTR